jgi:hypothetical protein
LSIDSENSFFSRFPAQSRERSERKGKGRKEKKRKEKAPEEVIIIHINLIIDHKFILQGMECTRSICVSSLHLKPYTFLFSLSRMRNEEWRGEDGGWRQVRRRIDKSRI